MKEIVAGVNGRKKVSDNIIVEWRFENNYKEDGNYSRIIVYRNCVPILSLKIGNGLMSIEEAIKHLEIYNCKIVEK